ncbi:MULTISPECIES: hypothetical protein [Clostridium]|nr:MULTISPECIES: hypothetical protein [Clostridium]MDU4855543.1 hypothetical protein [Clostridioides difficile]MCI3008199.1 hypothetical protein [Clostridium butyricum]MDB2138948.1 hypothetical protein [Clostridium butyricum]MDM8131743.1 hypothetical protein [Clostridium butyricum]MDM8228951.1 hypothetical protein [Clostridium butyricum]
MKVNTWKLWLCSSLYLLFVSIMNLINKESMTLQTKLGFKISKDCLYWIF